MISAASLPAFAVVSLGMVMTPGPNMIYQQTRPIMQGKRAGFISLLGDLPIDGTRRLFAMGFLTNLMNPKAAGFSVQNYLHPRSASARIICNSDQPLMSSAGRLLP